MIGTAIRHEGIINLLSGKKKVTPGCGGGLKKRCGRREEHKRAREMGKEALLWAVSQHADGRALKKKAGGKKVDCSGKSLPSDARGR